MIDRQAGGSRAELRPLHLAGFTTAFGAHSVAAVLGASTDAGSASALLLLGLSLAVYDLAEVVLKPVFGALSDRIGPRPVIVGGLVAFALVSAAGLVAPGTPALLAIRFGQGAAASAFSPASSAAVSRLADRRTLGTYFGRYGSWKGLGYAGGPLIGAGLVGLGGFGLLDLVLALLAGCAAVWVRLRVPSLAPVPRRRSTVLDLVRESTAPWFLSTTLLLAAAAGLLVTAIGFLPTVGRELGLGLLLPTVASSVVAVTSSVTQPFAGRALDRGRISARRGAALGIALAAVGLVLVALAPGVVSLFAAAALIGTGVGIATPLGFAALAAGAPPDRIGRTMGTAELGRELGDAGAPTLVGLVASPLGLPAGLLVLAAVVGGIGAGALALGSGTRSHPGPGIDGRGNEDGGQGTVQ